MAIQQIVAQAALSLACQGALAAEQHIVCPPEIPASSVQLANTAPEWKTFVSSPLLLHNAAPTSGPPEVLGQLRGETIHRDKQTWTERYSLHGRYPDGKWLQCDYGMLNEVSLSKRLDDSTTECTITGKKSRLAGQNAYAIVCK